ncbi:E3 ubiquitin-protein ligase Iruka [Teleopsis dalmanni]|uniref:E3 ubiquitin-protein ligase Iruka-like n=1 Tax=Teleopsis dalmanni TaxID=139649 RepID=UPI0018CDC7EB|nr:E3 ubiquitin-protein ligase Iruka-like [Teleopsis dalmanni]XP_037951604.1 E3 ubiquitin-protein ligase Iruka-like [Teleopsis dalmanni]XP_037955364.1 E3 ubiquitin-protein ligase Iruka [Teleopsis dalmanni]XP_037955365.1 E3 ubiquitin-protein ligase Iruka [Teleopsis dalmanni]
MAEAVAEERPTQAPRFYCHICNMEINIVSNTEFVCPLCDGGFVEELPPTPQPSGSNTSADSGNNASTSNPQLSGLDALRGEIATFLMSRNGPNVEISIDPGNRRGNVITIGGGSNSNANRGNTGGGRVRAQNLDRLDNVLLDFLHTISGDDIAFGNSPMFFMGNPGDYAWGREGIDTIVTQLLNQMETSGPPPLPKEKINEIPKHEVTSDEVDKKVQCSVCWEDFRLGETVRKLQCSHLYHENCIVPWLDLHGTCPICRKSLAEEPNEVIGSNENATNNLNRPLGRDTTSDTTGIRNIDNGASGIATNATNTATGGTSTSHTQTQEPNSTFDFERSNEDLD